MLEGVVARLLNKWLGKYVLDLDTENLNVGIFSGLVQLTELRLKPEALYELDLPIEVKFGTIGKISIQIPWNGLINQAVIVHVEDVHILAGPVLSDSDYDPEKEKRLTRAAKRKILSDLYIDGDLIGGPNLFPEHLITSLISNFQVVVQNVHVRYEDSVSVPGKMVSAGLCISSITAESTNNKWKASSTPKGSATGYHLLKVESFSIYWNYSCEPHCWNWKTQYYLWRNAMTNSLQTFSMNNEDFDFLIKPMTCKIKFIINKSNGTRILKLLVDIVLQDFTIHMTKDQYSSIKSVMDSMKRMRSSRQYLHLRPTEQCIDKSTVGKWWKYARDAVLEQRVRPYTWGRIAAVRASYRLYRDAYKQVLVNPNDTELKLDLQKYEDNLSVINIIIAREHARIMLKQEQMDCENSPFEKGRSFWSMLPSPERNHLCQMIGYAENTAEAPNSYHYIEHKYNLTVSNFNLSLLSDHKEILVVTLTQVLALAETRSSVGSLIDWNQLRKISIRAENFVIEGSSLEDHLVPLISTEYHYHSANETNMTPNLFSIDYEMSPSGSDMNCKLWCTVEAIEIVFHMHAISEILTFFDYKKFVSFPIHLSHCVEIFTEKLKIFESLLLNKRIDLNLDIKIPYFVLPEYGSMNKSGNLLILDFGRIVLRSDLTQSSENLEEATQMELEECAYSRVHIDLFHAQLLFCDSSENWRDSRKETDTEMHLVSKINVLVVFASCVKPDFKSLPKSKINVTVPSLKLNMSERKITLLLGFVEHFEQMLLPNFDDHSNKFENVNVLKSQWSSDTVFTYWDLKHLEHVRKLVSRNRKERKTGHVSEFRRASELSALTEHGSAEPSDYSEESSETWARCVDLPGLEDNVSPHNNIQNLVRIVVGEVCILLSRSSEKIDRPYLKLRLGKSCLDLAMMDYGPALQLTVASILLTDKFHTNISGQYLDLIHVPVPSDQDFFMLLYRKVRADCPDFRSHFHSVEKSLVADFGPINFLLHRDAIRALMNYTQYLYKKFEKHKSIFATILNSGCESFLKHTVLNRNVIDPPVPPGAVKFSNSARCSRITLRLCNADCDLLEIRIAGFEFDFMFRANERFVLRSYLNNLSIDHLTDVTLYTKILTTDEEKVFEIKYVRHAPRPHVDTAPEITLRQNDDQTAPDGSVRINVGRMQVTLLYKLLFQLQHFFKPLIETRIRHEVIAWLKGTVAVMFRTSATVLKLNLAVNIHGPTLLLPQKTASPNLIVINTGELSLENFFKETPTKSIIENVMIKLDGTTMLRAVMTLASSLEMQEMILEPLNIRLDIKKSIVCPRSANACLSRPPSWEIDGIIDAIKITLGQRDLTTLLAVYTDNINEGHFVEFSPESSNFYVESQMNSVSDSDDCTVRCLEAFFCQGESKYKDVCVKMNLEGMQLSLFCDCEEVLSSPVRDLNHGLCKLEIGETIVSSDFYTDTSLEAKLSVHSVNITDIRPDSNSTNKTVLQSYRDETKANTYQISVSTPPIIDISFHQNNMCDKFVDVIVERMCFIFSIPFLTSVGRFVFESMPCERRYEGGIVNHGYVADMNPNPTEELLEEVSDYSNECPGLTIGIRMCKPEFIFLSDAQAEHGNSFSMKAEILIDLSRHSKRENLIVSLSNLHMFFNCVHISEPYVLLHPCDFEFSKCLKTEDGIKSTITLSALQLHLCSKVFLTFIDILDDFYLHLNQPVEKMKHFVPVPFLNRSEKNETFDDLWSPKRLSQCYVTEHETLQNLNGNELEDMNQMFIASVSSITIILELENASNTTPVLLIQSSLETTLYDWSKQLHGTVEIHLQANYYNEQIERWEPLIEPISCGEAVYRPWEILVKIFQKEASPIIENTNQQRDSSKTVPHSTSTSGDEDTSSGGGMSFLRPQNSELGDKTTPRLTTSLAAFLEDSDSETEDGTMEKLASAICDLFTGDWNESEDSDCGHSSGTDQSPDSDSIEDKRRVSTASAIISTDTLATYILIDSRDILNLTLTTQSVRIVHDILVSYTDKTIHATACSIDRSITLINDIGPKAKVELLRKVDGQNGNIIVCSKMFEKVDSGPSSPAKSIDNLSVEESLDSNCSETRLHTLDYDCSQDNKDMIASLQFPELSTAEIYKMVNEEQLCVDVPGFMPVYTSCPRRTWQKLLKLSHTRNNMKYYLITEHKINRSGRTLVARSPLQIRNETSYPLGLFYERSVLTEMGLEPVGEVMNPFEGTVRVSVLEPHDEYNVPLHIAYHCKLFLQPANIESHHVSSMGLWWPELISDLGTARDLFCESKHPDSDSSVFSLRVCMEEGAIVCSVPRQLSRTIPNYLIRLLPPFIFYNCLPYAIDVKIPQFNQQIHVDAGDKMTLYSLNMQRTVKFLFELTYLGLLWTGMLNLTTDLDEKVLSMVTDYDTEGGNKQLAINVRIDRLDSCELFLYSPYWIVNKTGLPLQIKGSVSNIVYDCNSEEVILFSYKRQARQTVRVRAYQSSWSAEFSLDTIGTTGLVVARDKERNRRYPMLLAISLSSMSSRFTKIVTLLPNFLVYNNTKKHMRFMEENERTDLWLDLSPGQCVPFWPETQSMQMYVKYRDSKVVSQNFSTAQIHQTVLRMDKGSAVSVEVRGGCARPFTITFNCYHTGDAPCRVDNMCTDLHLKINQKNQGQVTLISPQHSLLYTWDDPCAERTFVWNVYNNKGAGFPLDIYTDGYGEVRIRLHSIKPGAINAQSPTTTTTIPIASSSSDSDSSSERQNNSLTQLAKKSMRRDKVVVYWLCYMDGSQRTVMFTQDHRLAVQYRKRMHFERCNWEMFLSLSGIGLSLCLSEPTSMEFAYASVTDSPALWEVNIAHKWKMLTLELASWVEDKFKSNQKKCQLKDYVHIDFEKMYMLKPFYGELRRTYYPALWIQYRKSNNHQFYRMKINSIQIENEPNANPSQFRILHPLMAGISKPFGVPCMEFSCFRHFSSHEFDIYKYVTFNMQEFFINVDRMFIKRLVRMFSIWTQSQEPGLNIRSDMALIHMPLLNFVSQFSNNNNNNKKIIIEHLQLGTISIQVNLHPKFISRRKVMACNILDYLFSCVENSYASLKEAKYILSAMEMYHTSSYIDLIFVDILNHYSSQFMQQFHVHVLGQEVLLNPYTSNNLQSILPHVGDPLSVCLEVEKTCRCLLGHVHGPQLLLTTTMGRDYNPGGHSLDQEHRRRRRYAPPHVTNFPETLSSVSRSFLNGVSLGFAGVLPISTLGDGQNRGVENFFRTSGKALASIMTRGGVTNCVDVATDAIRRALLMGERIHIRHKLPRHINTHLALKPFSMYEAMGKNLLMLLANGRYAETDTYWAHGALNSSGRSLLLITLQHIFLVENCRQWCPWDLEWCVELDDVLSVPKVVGQEMIINNRQDENKQQDNETKLTVHGDSSILNWLKEKIEQAMIISMEDKCWSTLEH